MEGLCSFPLEVFQRAIQSCHVVSQQAQACVTARTKQTTYSPGLVAVIYTVANPLRRVFKRLLTQRTASVLALQSCFDLSFAQAILSLNRVPPFALQVPCPLFRVGSSRLSIPVKLISMGFSVLREVVCTLGPLSIVLSVVARSTKTFTVILLVRMTVSYSHLFGLEGSGR
jgi:hypothetical protein